MIRLLKLVRNPKKYTSRAFLVPLARETRLRARAFFVYRVPFLVRAAFRRPSTIFVHPLPMDYYQAADVYVAWKVFAACDLRVSGREPEKAALAIAWSPATSCSLDPVLHDLRKHMRVLNARCTDIRKSVVDEQFRAVFGYGLQIDPATYAGTIFRKSERNGTHDGVLLEGPLSQVEPGYVYQRVISNYTPGGILEWRLFIVGGKPVAVFGAYAPADDRFRIFKRPEMASLNETFSRREQELLSAFCDRMGLDFGALDVLRDPTDGRLYVCDCNNTPTGPARRLSIPNDHRIVREIAAAFRAEYLTT